VNIRTASDDDWPAIWPLVEAAARAGETYALDPGLTGEQGRAMWMAGHVVVAEDGDGTILDTAKLGPNRDGPGAHIGTASFLVSEAARGVGRALGFTVVGTVPGAFRHPVHGYVGLHVMFLPLAPAAPAPPGPPPRRA